MSDVNSEDEAVEETPSLAEILSERSLLGLFLDPKEIADLLNEFRAQEIEKDQPIFSEGQDSKDFFIVANGEVIILSAQGTSRPIPVGVLKSGRSANLHSIIRELPYQYSGVAGKDCAVVKIPWAFLKPKIDRVDKLDSYLRLMTESTVVRDLSKEMKEIGLDKNFTIQLLGNLNLFTILAQQWIINKNNPPNFAFILLDGSISAFEEERSGTWKPLWELPKQIWHLMNETLGKASARHSLRSLTNSRILKISAEALLEISKKYPEDTAKYGAWLERASQGTKKEEEGEDKEVDSLADLFPPLPPNVKLAKKYPFVQQYNQMDCGPACLAMISKFYGNEIPIQYWREKVSTGREGTAMFDLAKASERAGFVSHGIGADNIKDVEKEVLPCIALREYHYLVVYEVREKYVLVGDPAVGLRKLSHAEFAKGFEGIVLLLKPTDSFFKIKVPIKGNQHYIELLKGYGREGALVLACSSVLVVLSLFPPILSQIILDEVLAKKDLSLLWFALIIGAAVVVCKGLMSWIRAYYLGYITSKFDFRAHSSFVRKMFSLPYSFFATRHVGDFTRRLSEMERIRTFFTSTVVSTLIDLSTLVLYAAVLIMYSPVIMLLCFILAPVLVGISILFSKRLINAYSDTFKSRSEQESLLTDLVKGIGTVKALGAETASRWRFEERLVKTLRSSYKFDLTASGLNSVSDAYNQLARFAVMGAAAYLGIKGTITPGQVVAVSMIVGSVIEPFNGLAKAWSGIQEMRTIMNRLNDIFLAPGEDSGGGRRGLTKSKLRGEIEFHDVWFRYGGDSSEWVLKGASFKILPGQNVAIVGPSGSGKSTISYLLARIYEPTKGQIFIDGRDYRDYDVAWLRSQVGLLHQESNLFYGSVAENIAYGVPKFEMASVVRAAELADADSFISKKGNTYEYVISHGGLGFSGGEKQRISLARTIFTNPSVLILDEATSALDGISERKLLTSIRTSCSGKTILSIAHRYTTVLMSDFALVIAEGRIVGFGTHEQLANENGVYAALFGTSIRRAA